MRRNLTTKKPSSEKQRPVFKAKQKQEKVKEKELNVLFYSGIPYILIGYPGYEQVYAVDEKFCVDYALTGKLRKLLEEDNNNVNKT